MCVFAKQIVRFDVTTLRKRKFLHHFDGVGAISTKMLTKANIARIRR